MSNELNILPAGFNDKADKFFIDDPIVLIKILNDPNWTAFKTLGRAEIDKIFTIENEYAEFKAGIPQRLIAKDVVSSKQMFESKLKSIQAETIALLSQSIIETGTGDTKVFMGSELPVQVYIALILQGKTRDGKQVELRIRKLVMSTETVKIALGGKEYSTLDFKAEVLVDDDPLVNNFEWSVLGEVETTATTTSADDEITVASPTGIVQGMRAFGAGIPEGATVFSIASSVVTLSANASATGALVTVKFATAENILKSDVAYWIFES